MGASSGKRDQIPIGTDISVMGKKSDELHVIIKKGDGHVGTKDCH